MNYNTVSGKTNFLLVSVASMFGLLVIIVAYYIYAAGDPETSSKLYRDSAARKGQVNGNNTVSNNASSNVRPRNNATVPKDPLVGVKPKDVTPTDVPTGFEKKTGNVEPQVFNVSENIYTYDDAEAVCKAFGSELATYEQLVDSYKNGADWCNYGWSKGQMALYPTQYKTWLKMQENDPDRRDVCGLPGINGGYFDNKHLMFGVNCYGVKPVPRDHERTRRKNLSDKDIKLGRKIADIRSKQNEITLLPFNEDKWSGCSL